MNPETYDQEPVNASVLNDNFKFVKENMECTIYSYKGKVFNVEPPFFVELEVTETDPGFAGNTATNATKPATVETGAEIKVPLFIERGEKRMNLVEKAAYLKGLAEGLGMDAQSKEGRLWAALNDLLADMAHEIEDLHEADDRLDDALDELAGELSYLEELSCDLEKLDDDDDGAADDDDAEYDGVVYDATCPVCGEEISFDEETLESGSIRCPKCGELLEFDLGSDAGDKPD